ncbi:MAG TPA: phospholipid carrier-dependent glycosyltransferase, partial [Anaerolineae bacterium]|nr:phospholipid carrier-dependent glycosyltransferase [Anaerolineae bacterium]
MTNDEMTNEGMTKSQSTNPQPANLVIGHSPLVISHWSLVILTLTSFALRLYALGRAELWFDEALSANISALGWGGIIAHLRSQPFEHPPLYFLALYPWQQVAGRSEFALRFFSVFWGVLSVPLFYVLVRRLTGARLGLLAALLATASPFLVAYSREARMYSLLPFLALLALLAFRRALEQEERPRWWLAYGLLLAVGVTTHYFFAFLWAATAAYLLLMRPRRPGWAWGGAVHLLALLAGVAWFALSPGLRASLWRLVQGEAAFGLAYKLNKIIPTLILGEVSGGVVPTVAQVLALGGWLLVLAGAWWSLREGLLPVETWRLLGLILVAPLLLALLLPYGVLGRHLGYLLAVMIPFLALALSRRGAVWRAASALLLLLIAAYALPLHLTRTNGDTGQALAYIDRRGQPGDLLIVTQPGQEPLMDYYNRRGWPVRYLPEAGRALDAETVDRTLSDLARSHDRLWLGPIGAWTADPDHLVEQWLAAHAFQAFQTWFPASGSAALYLTPVDDLTAVAVEQPTWGGLIRLEQLQTGPLQVAPGEALPLRFIWRAGLDLDRRYAVHLRLVDDLGQVWAERRSEPCSGWCPTDGWRAGQLREDRHALWVPPGTPPGRYRLRLEWTPLEGGPPLPPEQAGGGAGSGDLVEIAVLPPPPGAGVPADLPHPLTATFGEAVRLRGYDLRPAELRPGETLHLELHWQAGDAPQEADALLIELAKFETWPTTPWGRFATRAGEQAAG